MSGSASSIPRASTSQIAGAIGSSTGAAHAMFSNFPIAPPIPGTTTANSPLTAAPATNHLHSIFSGPMTRNRRASVASMVDDMLVPATPPAAGQESSSASNEPVIPMVNQNFLNIVGSLTDEQLEATILRFRNQITDYQRIVSRYISAAQTYMVAIQVGEAVLAQRRPPVQTPASRSTSAPTTTPAQQPQGIARGVARSASAPEASSSSANNNNRGGGAIRHPRTQGRGNARPFFQARMPRTNGSNPAGSSND